MLKSFQLQNFKAVRDSKTIKFTPLTVFIGANGAGKSSIIEGLFTYQKIIQYGLDSAMNYWRGFEYIRNLGASHTQGYSPKKQRLFETNPIEFKIQAKNWSSQLEINITPGGNELFISQETLQFKLKNKITMSVERSEQGKIVIKKNKTQLQGKCLDGESVIKSLIVQENADLDILDLVSHWQFINLNPSVMGSPYPEQRTKGKITLNSDGSNIAEYLLNIYKLDEFAFTGILEAVQLILPYARDLQPTITSEIDRNVYLQLVEKDFKVPGWLLSTGTLRLLSLLALLRHPNPAPLIVIEEIENGLDPKTIHLIIEEIRSVVETGKTQVILTTHSPYLLDLLSLSQIILVERDETGQPIFTKPADQDSLEIWSKKFGPGKLYTMNQLSGKG